jgi:hypothetical protein
MGSVTVTAWEDRLNELADSKSMGTAMFLKTTAETTESWQCGSQNQRTHYRLPRRKDIAYDALPYPGIESLGVSNGAVAVPTGKTV